MEVFVVKKFKFKFLRIFSCPRGFLTIFGIFPAKQFFSEIFLVKQFFSENFLVKQILSNFFSYRSQAISDSFKAAAGFS